MSPLDLYFFWVLLPSLLSVTLVLQELILPAAQRPEGSLTHHLSDAGAPLMHTFPAAWVSGVSAPYPT